MENTPNPNFKRSYVRSRNMFRFIQIKRNSGAVLLQKNMSNIYKKKKKKALRP